jgi:hypothetical protein
MMNFAGTNKRAAIYDRRHSLTQALSSLLVIIPFLSAASTPNKVSVGKSETKSSLLKCQQHTHRSKVTTLASFLTTHYLERL